MKRETFHPSYLHSKASARRVLGVGAVKLDAMLANGLRIIDGRIPQWAIDLYQNPRPIKGVVKLDTTPNFYNSL